MGGAAVPETDELVDELMDEPMDEYRADDDGDLVINKDIECNDREPLADRADSGGGMLNIGRVGVRSLPASGGPW